MRTRDIIVVGASAGGVEALVKLVGGLPHDLPAALFVVLHIPPTSASLLPRILSNAGPLPAMHPTDGEAIQHGRIYVAPPDYHLLVRRGLVRVVRGPRENNHRPAVDPLFRSAANAYGNRVIAVVLSGTLDDGAAGCVAVSRRGGVGVAQDPADALFSGMPRSAIAVDTSHVLPASEIPSLLMRLVREPIPEQDAPVPEDMEAETQMAESGRDAVLGAEPPGTPSSFGCPECGGVLWELREENIVRFRCRTGHAYSSQSLLAMQSERVEAALWAALRGLEERAALTERLARRAGINGPTLSGRFEEQAREAREHAEVIRQFLLEGTTDVETALAPAGD